jgi:serine/threonine protein kinase
VLTVSVLGVIHALHAIGINHNDVKGSNILLAVEHPGEVHRPDHRPATFRPLGSATSAPMGGAGVGINNTLAYMAPT